MKRTMLAEVPTPMQILGSRRGGALGADGRIGPQQKSLRGAESAPLPEPPPTPRCRQWRSVERRREQYRVADGQNDQYIFGVHCASLVSRRKQAPAIQLTFGQRIASGGRSMRRRIRP